MIAEDQALLRDGLVRLFTDHGHEVVAALGDAAGLVETCGRLTPDLVVLDIRMPPTHTDEGARAAHELKSLHPGTGVLLLSQHVETGYAVDLVTHGGFGYLLKDRVLDVATFLDAATRVSAGGSALDPFVVRRMLDRQSDDDPVSTLSQRERDVLSLMAQGLTNTAIARDLVVSERTVEGHVRHLMLKLGLAEVTDGHRRVLAVLAHLRHSGFDGHAAGR